MNWLRIFRLADLSYAGRRCRTEKFNRASPRLELDRSLGRVSYRLNSIITLNIRDIDIAEPLGGMS